jgi:integrase
VPLTAATVAALRRHKLAQAPDRAEDGGLVFRSATGGPIDGDNLTRAWARALRKAGVRHVPLHSLRHLGVSRMIAAGASPKVIQSVVGHANIALTFDLYGHLMPDSLDTLASGLGALAEAPAPAAGVTAGDTGRAEGLAN